MNRLQKKCVIATVGFHLLLATLLLVGPAFFNPKPKETDTHLLDVIPANLVDSALNSGVQNAVPPPPQPPAPQPQIQPPTPAPEPERTPPPKPVVTPAPVPTPEKIEKPVKRTEPKPEPKPAPKLNASDLKPVTRRETKNSTTRRDDSQRTARAINNALKNLRNNLAPGTVVDVPGTGSVSSASYRDALASIYYDAWTTPDGVLNDAPNAVVRITVAADGTVVNARIITPSGDRKVDDSVQRALDRVTSVPPLPDQSKAQQEFTISFNLQTKRMSE